MVKYMQILILLGILKVWCVHYTQRVFTFCRRFYFEVVIEDDDTREALNASRSDASARNNEGI